MRKKISKAFAILGLPIAALVGFSYWLNALHEPPDEYVKQVSTIVDNLKKPHLLLIKAVWRPVLILEFIGFSLLPLSFALFPRFKEVGDKKRYSYFLLFGCAGICSIFFLITSACLQPSIFGSTGFALRTSRNTATGIF